jgi:hypothetical protein
MSPPSDVRVSNAPATNQDIYDLEKACLRAARAQGKTGKLAQLEAARLYNAAMDEARRQVREPATQPSVLAPPTVTVVPGPTAPRGMELTESGLYAPAK